MRRAWLTVPHTAQWDQPSLSNALEVAYQVAGRACTSLSAMEQVHGSASITRASDLGASTPRVRSMTCAMTTLHPTEHWSLVLLFNVLGVVCRSGGRALTLSVVALLHDSVAITRATNLGVSTPRVRWQLPAIHTHVGVHGHMPRLCGRVALVLVLVAAKGESHHLLAAAALVTPS
jgi:hypothetical protein